MPFRCCTLPNREKKTVNNRRSLSTHISTIHENQIPNEDADRDNRKCSYINQSYDHKPQRKPNIMIHDHILKTSKESWNQRPTDNSPKIQSASLLFPVSNIHFLVRPDTPPDAPTMPTSPLSPTTSSQTLHAMPLLPSREKQFAPRMTSSRITFGLSLSFFSVFFVSSCSKIASRTGLWGGEDEMRGLRVIRTRFSRPLYSEEACRMPSGGAVIVSRAAPWSSHFDDVARI